MVSDERYTCECCGGTFLKGQTDEAAIAEAKAAGLFDPGGDNALLCDDCYDEFLNWLAQRDL